MARAVAPALAVGGPPRVNLMPRAETERRAASALLRRWLWCLVAALAVVAIAVAGAFALETLAQQRLAAENTRTQVLNTRMAELSPIRTKLGLQSELADFRAKAMSADLRWTHLTETVQAALPPGVSLIGFTLEPGGTPAGDDATAEVGAFGTVTLLSQQPRDMASIVRTLRPVADVRVAEGWETKAEDVGFTFVVRIAFDQTVYSGRLAPEVTE